MGKYAFDEAMVDPDGSPLADSAFAHKILVACGAANLKPNEMDLLVNLLASGDLLSSTEADAIKQSMKETVEENDGVDPSMASDSAIMARRRQQVAAGLRPASDLLAPIYRVPTDADRERFKDMFPNANRIGGT